MEIPFQLPISQHEFRNHSSLWPIEVHHRRHLAHQGPMLQTLRRPLLGLKRVFRDAHLADSASNPTTLRLKTADLIYPQPFFGCRTPRKVKKKHVLAGAPSAAMMQVLDRFALACRHSYVLTASTRNIGQYLPPRPL